MIASTFAHGAAKLRAHFSYRVMPHQADDNPGNSWEISGGPVEALNCRGLGKFLKVEPAVQLSLQESQSRLGTSRD